MYECYLQETRAQDPFLQLNELEELSRLTTSLTKLESISTMRDEYDPFSPPHGFIEQCTGFPASGLYAGRPFASIFAASSHLPLLKMHVDALPWYIFSELIEMPGTAQRLNRLQELHVGLYNTEFINYRDRDALRSLRRFFEQCNKLEKISLDLVELPFFLGEWRFWGLEAVPRGALYRFCFPRLASLQLRGCITLQSRLVTFLEAHSPTLEILELADLMLVRRHFAVADIDMSRFNAEDHTSFHHSSILSLFQSIYDICRLRKVRIRGNFTNRYDEAWYVNDSVKEGFVPKLQRFLCRQGPWPFPPLSKYQRMQADSMATHESPAEEADGAEPEPAAMQFCDDTLEWCPELLR